MNDKELKEIMKEYTLDLTNPEYDDEQLALWKAINSLDEGSRIIFLIYAEYQSLRRTAAALGVSYATARKTINKIKARIKEYATNTTTNTSDNSLHN